MKFDDLLRDFRRPTRFNDQAKPYLVPDEDVAVWATEAERQTCMRARLIYDETTREICRINVTQGRIRYPIDSRINELVDLWIDRPPAGQPTSSHRMRLVDQSNGQRRPFPYLIGTNYDFDTLRTAPGSDYGNTCGGWNDALQTGNRLHEASIDGNLLTLYTIPDQSFAADQAPAVLRLCVYRMPLCPITEKDQCFEIPERAQDGLIYWLLYRANGGQDAELDQQQKSAAALAQFTARYGELPDANSQRTQQENRSNCMTYSGY